MIPIAHRPKKFIKNLLAKFRGYARSLIFDRELDHLLLLRLGGQPNHTAWRRILGGVLKQHINDLSHGPFINPDGWELVMNDEFHTMVSGERTCSLHRRGNNFFQRP